MINWETYLKIVSILEYHTAKREVYVDFWLKYFNQYNLTELPMEGILKAIELLARGVYTNTSTLVSKYFAKTFQKTLTEKNLITGVLSENIDMIRFKNMLNNGEIDIEPLNLCLKQEMEYNEVPDSRLKMFEDN